jgi:hypothetical protein
MTVTISNTGIVKNTYDAKVTSLINAFQQIYGSDVNFDSNTKNGQQIGVFALSQDDTEQKLLDIVNIMNPDNASGLSLDNIANISGTQRKSGTFTIQTVRITTDRVITLTGLDDNYSNIDATAFGVKDNQGNTFYLVTTTTLTIGDNDLIFRASTYGSILTQINTITQQINVVFGITNITNTQSQSTIGYNEESDLELRIRRNKSLSISAYNIEDSIYANLLENTDATDAEIYVNHTNQTDSDGVLSGNLWCIVEGGSDASIAKILSQYCIYNPLKGNVSVSVITNPIVTTKNNKTDIKPSRVITVLFDRPISAPLNIKFNLKRLRVGQVFDLNAIKAYIVDNAIFKIGSDADATYLGDQAQNAISNNGGGGQPLNLQISKDNGVTWDYYLTTTARNYKFTLSINNIAITVI